ncbi:Arm DNA-binding domain-containing protein [Pedobacter antarcticus]|uniref:Arm DNA-binding domain-containing protein n=1 Tax=Pedobacter antarcticus TaxID=34086 RepID=UPI00088F018E|nr:Arm DNA-binding domain-containing protein [Pedobacter antarcticus]SDM86947.1 hypothetical protein SAMN04488084_11642 [Pedobacter antarcticus]
MMKTNLSLLFYLKKKKNYISGNTPIYMRITVDGNVQKSRPAGIATQAVGVSEPAD